MATALQIPCPPLDLGIAPPKNAPKKRRQVLATLAAGVPAIAEARNLRLGSPAPSSDKAGMDWLEAFMKQAKRQKLRVDFIAVHWYRSRNAEDFEDFVKDLARSRRLPVWITEFDAWSGPEKEHHEFVKDSLRFLERNRDVERYAYFKPGKGKPHSLLKNDRTPTRIGELYRAAGS